MGSAAGPVALGIFGVAGRMGRELLAAALDDPRFVIAGGVARPGSASVGEDLGSLIGQPALGISVLGAPQAALEAADVIVDVSNPAAASALIEQARDTAVVTGTTGWSSEQEQQLRVASTRIPLLVAPNFSRGVLALSRLVAEAVRLLGPEYGVEIVEVHHARKVDAPSGTALQLADVAATAAGNTLGDVARMGRAGATGPRSTKEIGISAVRGGDVTGEHTVYFIGNGERLELAHRTTSRAGFITGALDAAAWVVSRPPGYYEMADLVGF